MKSITFDQLPSTVKQEILNQQDRVITLTVDLMCASLEGGAAHSDLSVVMTHCLKAVKDLYRETDPRQVKTLTPTPEPK